MFNSAVIHWKWPIPRKLIAAQVFDVTYDCVYWHSAWNERIAYTEKIWLHISILSIGVVWLARHEAHVLIADISLADYLGVH